jgi:RNA polymerase sigma-70 factor (ECF subfamily)
MIIGKTKTGREKDDFHREALVHLDALYNGALYMTRDPRKAEDLVQDTMLKAFRFFHRYQRGTNCKAWLFRIMTNTHINNNRGKRRNMTYLENVDVEPAVGTPLSDRNVFYKNPEQGYLHHLVHDKVREAVESLPLDYRTIVVLADLQDFAYKEIAEIVECPIGTVMSRLHRGRKLLQKRLRAHAIEQGILPPTAANVEDEPTSLEAYRQRKESGSE